LPHRELYTFFSTSGKSAIKRVELVDFGDAGTSTLLDFDLANAHCYSPEDEAKLRSIIESGGASAFNEMIREGMYSMVHHTRARSAHVLSSPLLSPRCPLPLRLMRQSLIRCLPGICFDVCVDNVLCACVLRTRLLRCVLGLRRDNIVGAELQGKRAPTSWRQSD
jgi:hypothetical protein